jgi:hypothetical protein
LSAATPGNDLVWRDARELTLEGQGWPGESGPYCRLPRRAEGRVSPDNWRLSFCSAGIVVRFTADSPVIAVRWKLREPWIEDVSQIQSPVGYAGVDLYTRHDGRWRWLSAGWPGAKLDSEMTLVTEVPAGAREYALYLPLITGVERAEIGAVGSPVGSAMAQASSLTRAVSQAKSLIFYGTSIVHGACASRAGMAYPAILGRRLERPTINLGFCGSAKMEPAIGKLLAELDPAVYVIDCLPNMVEPMITERCEPLVRTLRAARPGTPIVLVESIIYERAYLVAAHRNRCTNSNVALRAAYERLRDAGVTNLHLVPGANLLGGDGEATVDGTHPTDLGFTRIADALEPVLRSLVH